LATDKRFKLMSLDDLIVYEANGQSIPQIVEERDWRGFRDLEYEVRLAIAIQ
jgi:shikimate kinase